MMITIGITGGVGAGKSTVLDFLEEKYQAYVMKADEIGHLVMEPGQSCYEPVIALFGRQIIKNDKTIDRRQVSDVVFSHPELLEKLNQIIHPAVKQYIREQLAVKKQQGQKICVVEAALLLEDHYQEFCDTIWYIHTDEEIECSNILEKLLENGLLADTYDAAKRSLYDITTFGEILIDFTWQGVSDTGQTLFAQNPGGAPANVAVAAEKLGAHTAFIGKAGKDMHGEFLKSVLEKEKVDTKGMLLDENYFTTLAFVSVAENGERSFSFARKPGADTKIEKEEINVDILDKTTLFHVGSLSLTEQPARNTTHYAIRRAKEKGSIISYDPNYRASLWKDKKTAKEQMRSLIPYVDLMKISDEETELLTGKEKPEEAAKLLFEKGVKIVVVTLGSKGAYLYCKEGGLQIPGFVSKVADTNGAGDSFWGGFLYRISKSGKKPEEFTLNELKEYVRFGNAVASLCVEKKGAIPAMPTLMEVRERMGQ